jgi:branched-chain amino acid transport system ATP-binding protein
MSRLLEIENLHVAYGKAEVVHGVSLMVGEGEFVAMIGRNGAGKSTTPHAASGLIAKRGGKVRFAGQDVTGATPATSSAPTLCRYWKVTVSFIR